MNLRLALSVAVTTIMAAFLVASVALANVRHVEELPASFVVVADASLPDTGKD